MSSIRQFRKDLRTYLLVDATILALLDTRLYSVRGDQKITETYAVMEIVDGRDTLAHDGACNLEDMRVQFTIVASTSDATDAVRDAFYNRLHPVGGLNGVIGASTKIGFCILDNEIDQNSSTSGDIIKIIDFRLKLNGPQ
jgi:hypothetical protein